MTLTGELRRDPGNGTALSAALPDEKLKCRSLNLLRFSVAGICFGVDADQVTAISAYRDATDEDLVWFHEPMGFGTRTVEYRRPNVITVRSRDGLDRVVIDSMEDIAELSQSGIRPLPAVLEPFALQRGIWGVLVRQDSMTLLLYFMRISLRPLRHRLAADAPLTATNFEGE